MKANLVLNGEPLTDILHFDNSIFTICADGGYDWCKSNNFRTDLIVGDMDSVKNNIDKIQKLEYNLDKDKTDGELAVLYLIDNGFNDIDIFCAGGGSEDHFLSNLGILDICLERKISARLITNYAEIYLFNKSMTMKVAKNTRFSLVPFCDTLHIMGIKGAKYDTSKLEMPICSSRGISNVANSSRISVDITAGKYLIFIKK